MSMKGLSLLFMGSLMMMMMMMMVDGFTIPSSYPKIRHESSSPSFVLSMDNNNILSESDDEFAIPPQVFATGYSSKPELVEAIDEAVKQAKQNLPNNAGMIDLAFVTISSLYDAQVSPTMVVPTVLASSENTIQNVIGCSTGGIISSRPFIENDEKQRECIPLETEGLPGVSITLCQLPDVNVQLFHLEGEDVPDDVGRIPTSSWKQSVGLSNFSNDNDDKGDEIFVLIPSPSFQTDMNDFLAGLQYNFPSSTTLGGMASTVSSLSRSRLFCYSTDDSNSLKEYAYMDGCVGVALKGDIQVKVSIAQGAKPVGGIYRVVSGQDSTISAIQLDETATSLEKDAMMTNEQDDDEEDDDDEDELDEFQLEEREYQKKQMAQAYAKAVIPKPVLAEANYLMKSLSDDDRAFMSRALLVGLERGGALGQSPSQLIRLAQGKGHSFTVHQVASAGMKDGSVTLPLGSVSIERGARLRFFVREGNFAKKELEALWTGYKKQIFEETFLQNNNNDNDDADDGSNSKKMFTPTGCLLLTTLDRGVKLFGGKSGYESTLVSDFLPSVPSISGFFSNGVIGKLDQMMTTSTDENNNNEIAMVHGSASCFALFGSKSGRPVYSPSQAAAAAKRRLEKAALNKNAGGDAETDEDDQASAVVRAIVEDEDSPAAPRQEDGELVLKRREVHSGRALTVSTVEWSVAEKTAKPTSVLEGFMWEKETEVDRLRERVPLANLVSQCKLYLVDPSKPKPRDWIGPIIQSKKNQDFVIIPECKRVEPTSGSLRKRYNLSKLVKQLTTAGAPAISVNCDAILYGGKLEDVTVAREASASAALAASDDSDDGVISPPILASDLILYPYQLYKLRLAGADAANLQVAALEDKDLLYMTKIATSLQMQLVACVTSDVQIERVGKLSVNNSIKALVVSNRDMETFALDETGEQALKLLRGDAIKEFRSKHPDVLILVEGRVGMVDVEQDGGSSYLQVIKEAGASGAIVGSGLAYKKEEDGGIALKALLADLE